MCYFEQILEAINPRNNTATKQYGHLPPISQTIQVRHENILGTAEE